MKLDKMFVLWLFFGALSLTMGLPQDPPLSKCLDDNGELINITEAPFLAILRDEYELMIGTGSIIHERFILTTGYFEVPERFWHIIVGITHLKERGDRYEIEETFLHMNYSFIDLDYSVTLVKLSKPITFKDNVKKVNLSPHDDNVKLGDQVTAFGWGVDKWYFSNNLVRNKLPIADNTMCEDVLRMTLTERMFCVGDGKKDLLHGNFGGPVVDENGDQVGIATWGHQCATTPMMYTKVSKLIDWINETIAKHS